MFNAQRSFDHMKILLKRIIRVALALFLILNIMAAVHAYHFTHFSTDPSLKRLNKDEMTWSQKASAIFFGIKSPKSINEIRPAVKYETVYLKTKDGLNLEGWQIRTEPSKGTVLLFHGHGSCKSKVLEEGLYFRSLHYNIFLLDFRAHGGSDGEVCTIGAKEAEDVKLAFDYIRNSGEKNIILWGTSLGAATISKAIYDYNIEPQKIILEMPFGSLLKAVKARVRIMGIPTEPIASILTFWGGVEQGFWAFDHCPSEYVKKIKCPVLLQWGIHDGRVSAEEANEIFQNIQSSKKFVRYETASHQSLYKKEPAKWQATINTFLAIGVDN